MKSGRPWSWFAGLFPASGALHFHRVCLLAILLACCLPARAPAAPPDKDSVASVTGQFMVTRVDNGLPAYRRFNPGADTNILQLKPAVVAIAAERFKNSVNHLLGFPPNASWSGKIYLQLHPTPKLDDTVTIVSTPFLDHWNYLVEMPEALTQIRYARALAGVLLLEIANRHAPRGGHSAEIPPWLVDGLALQIQAVDGDKVMLSAPRKKDEPLLINRLNETERGLDALEDAREVLQNAPALTFDQLSWPTGSQMAGNDGAVYYASAQLFVSELLAQRDGPAKMRAFLADLPQYYNWQTAFFRAFGSDFKRPLDVEKWWALRVLTFAQRAPGPRWTTDVSIVRLQGLLSVPVEFRGQSNTLPTHAEISLQSALQNLTAEQRDLVVRTKMRDLGLIELRLAPPFGDLADAYRLALAAFLGDLRRSQVSVVNKHGAAPSVRSTVVETVKQLNALDARRRDAETKSMAALRSRSTLPPSP